MVFSKVGIDTETGGDVCLPQASRIQGLSVIGVSGTGKSTLVSNLLVQDIEQGRGGCLIDPHGDVTKSVLSRISPGRIEDVIYLDSTDAEYPFGLNLLECKDITDELEVQYTLEQVRHIFEKVYGISSDTPRMYDYLTNYLYTLIVNPGCTLLDIRPLLTNEVYREKLLENVSNNAVLNFWNRYNNLKEQAQHDENNAILNRLNDFEHAPLRNIIGQSRSTINLQEIMAQGKILLVKLDAHRKSATALIGSILVAKMLNAGYARAEGKRRPFPLYIDECPNIVTKDFATLITEARKFGIAVTVAYRSHGQLDAINKEATLSMANLVVFRVLRQDAEELAPVFDISPLDANLSPDELQDQTPIEDRKRRIGEMLANLSDYTARGKFIMREEDNERQDS